MDPQNLLKQFYEERLETSFGIKFETLSDPVRIEIEKMHNFQLWKLNRAIRDLAEVIKDTVLAAKEWERKRKLNGEKQSH